MSGLVLDPNGHLPDALREELEDSVSDEQAVAINAVIDAWGEEDLVGTLDDARLDLERRVLEVLK